MTIGLPNDWFERLRITARRKTMANEEEFIKLVECAEGKCDMEAAKALMGTFSSDFDFGTQENVIAALSTATDAIFVRALLEELPRLEKEAPGWIPALLGPEVQRRCHVVQEQAKNLPVEAKMVLRRLQDDTEFLQYYPNISHIAVL